MTQNVEDRMSALSSEIDQKIDSADINLPFSDHFNKWWQKANEDCGRLYSEAGEISSISHDNAEAAVKWLNEQISKLHEFVKNYSG